MKESKTAPAPVEDPIELVDGYLAHFGEAVGVRFPPLDELGYSEVQRGSATVGINVLAEDRVLLLLARVGRVPRDDPESLLRQLLEANFLDTGEAAFAIDPERDLVFVRAMRRIDGLDYQEFEDLLQAVATVADEWSQQVEPTD